MRSVRVLSVVALVLGFCGMARANIFIDQTSFENNRRTVRADSKDGPNSIMADDFTARSSVYIYSVGLRGTFDSGWDNGQLVGFEVNFYADNAGAPGGLLSTQDIASGWSQSRNLFTIPLVAPQVFAAGTYWVGFQALLGGQFTGEFRPMWANDTGIEDIESSSTPTTTYIASGAAATKLATGSYGRYWGGDIVDGFSWKTVTPVGNNEKLDLAFSLSTYVCCPEPSSTVLVGMGLVGLLAYCWRRRAK